MSRAQSSLEYMLILTIIVAALLSMNVYIRRAQQGNYRRSADQLGSGYNPKYNPQHTRSDIIFKMYTGEIARTEIREAPVVIDGKNKTELTSTTNFDREDTTDTGGWEQVSP